MRQSHVMSLVEALANVVVGYGAARGGSGNLNSRDEWIFRATAA